MPAMVRLPDDFTMSAPAVRKPWPMRWVVAIILLFLVPYTYLNIKYRKPGRAFEPYADFKAQAQTRRLLDAGYTRAPVIAERPAPPLAAAKVFTGPAAPALSAAAGLPSGLADLLIDQPALPTGYSDLLAGAETTASEPLRIQVKVRLDDPTVQLGGADVYLHPKSGIVIVPFHETVPEGLRTRRPEEIVLLTVPPGLIKLGRHEVLLAGRDASLRWTFVAR